MKLSWTIFLVFFIINTSFAIEVIINVPCLTPTAEKIYITGNTPALCMWKPDCLELKKNAPFTYSIRLTDISSKTEIKITRGTWNSEAANSVGLPLPNFTLPPNNEQIVINIPNWRDLNLWGIKGKLIILEEFYSPELDNYRSIYVLLPPNYDGSQKNYPVIYTHDGQNLFDPKLSAFGNEWGVDEILQNGVMNIRFPEAIIIGVSSNADRTAEYSYLRKGERYAKFLITTLRPFINKRFRTLANRENTYVMGSSMGALISFSLLWRHANIFSKAAGLSLPAFAYDYEIFNFLKKYPEAPRNISFYMDHGGQGQDAKYYSSAKSFYQTITQESGLPTDKVIYQTFPWADHTEIDWSRRLYFPLDFLLN